MSTLLRARFIGAMLSVAALVVLASGVAGQTATLVTLTAQSSLTTPLILYNVGAGLAVQAPLNLGSSGGRFNLISLQTALTDPSSQLVFSATSCSDFSAPCSFSTPTQLVAPLISINLYAGTECHFADEGGVGSGGGGQLIESACNGSPQPTDAWVFFPNGASINSFMILKWDLISGAYCMAPTSTTAQNQQFETKACNPSDALQLWQLYQNSS